MAHVVPSGEGQVPTRAPCARTARSQSEPLVAVSRDALERLVEAARSARPDLAVELQALGAQGLVKDRRRDDAEPATRGARLARKLHRLRRQRDAHFRSGLFSEPAWDILLDLYAAQHEQRSICITSACIAAAVPATTALRWIMQLEKEGLVRRKADPRDARRFYLRLSRAGLAKMENLLLDAIQLLEAED